MSARADLRRAVRRSGVAACLAVVVFGGAGLHYLTQVDRPPRLADETWAAGEPIELAGDPVILWAPDLSGSADDVTCTVSGARADDGVLSAGPDASRAELASVTVDGRRLTYLARVRGVPGGEVACEGEALREVLVSDDLRPGLERGSAIGFLAASGVAALWALVALRVGAPPRPRDDRRV